MNIYSLYSAVTENFTYPNTPDALTMTATVTHEFGDVILQDEVVTNTTGNNYELEISNELVDAAGVYQIKWVCEFSGTAFYAYSNFTVESRYITEDAFMDLYTDYNIAEFLGEKFEDAELLARNIINTFCGQYFQPINNKTLNYDGNGRDKLHLGIRISTLNEANFVDGTGSTDYIDSVEIDPQSRYFLRIRPFIDTTSLSYTKFPNGFQIQVKGDWGWTYVPSNIEQAAGILVADILQDTRRQHKRYGIVRQWQDTQRFEFNSASLETTGNTDADVLLMDYVYWTPDYVA